jgi:hypothetical protein
MSRWLADKMTSVLASRTNRRGMLVRSAVVGSALATNPADYILRPMTAFAAACQCRGQPCVCGTPCCDGYTEFCCTITGHNRCPNGTVTAGWWKADGTPFCGGPRYYMDCNQITYPCGCTCANGSCANRVSCCNFFRYGQCHQEIPQVGPIVCRVITCTPPWLVDPACTTVSATDQATAFHDAPCLHAIDIPPPPLPPTALVTAMWYLRASASSGTADVTFPYGMPFDRPIVGDWDGDGVATPGVIRGNTFYLRNSNTAGIADIVFPYGNPGDEVIVGDWNGDGRDTIGVRRGNTFYLRNSNTAGVADIVFPYGEPGDKVIVGRWTAGAQSDTVGVVRGNTFYLRNSNSAGIADIVFPYGDVGDKVVVGDWDGDGVDTPCVIRGSTFYARNSNSTGVADVVFQYGDPNDLHLVGRWAAGGSPAEGPGSAR